MSRSSPLVVKHVGCSNHLMRDALANVLVYAVGADITAGCRSIGLRVDEAVVVIHAWQKCSSRLVAIFACQPKLGYRSLELRTVFLSSRQRIGQSQNDRRVRLRRSRRGSRGLGARLCPRDRGDGDDCKYANHRYISPTRMLTHALMQAES